jgi:glycosyltransferase involved in cell wall biosynthesis
MKNSVILMPLNLPWDWPTGYHRETAKILTDNSHTVFLYNFIAPIPFKKIIQLFSIQGIMVQLLPNIFLYTPVFLLPFARFRVIEWLNHVINLGLLRLYIRWRHPHTQNKYLWIFDPEFSPYLSFFLKTWTTLYDCVDYACSNSDFGRNKKEQYLLTHVKHVFVNSTSLADIHRPIRPDLTIVPQGFRIGIFRYPKKIKVQLPKNKKIIGYIGTIDYRFHFQLLEQIVSTMPKHLFVFVGPTIAQKKMQRIFSYPNVKYINTIPNEEAPSIIRQFDIGIIPYDASLPINRYCFPMKIFEYFYLGKPVISTTIEEFKRYQKYIRIGNSIKEWEKFIQELLNKPWPKQNTRDQRKIALKNSWDEKISTILEKMNELS